MTYSYICTSCGHEWEAEQRISEAPLQVCPNCNQSSAKRQIAGPANFILKGGGWYSDLYSSSSGKKSDGDKGGDKGGGSSGGDKSGSGDKSGGGDKAEKADKPAEKADKPAEKKSDTSSGGAAAS